MKIFALIFLLIKIFKAQEVATRSSLLGPRNFNYHAVDPKQNPMLRPATSRKGPVLFPPSPSPPPATPLIVTSKPLLESIARSDLNGNQTSNSITEQTQINPVTLPSYLAELANYRPTLDDTLVNRYTLSPTIGFNILNEYSFEQRPYIDPVRSISNNFDNRFTEFETRTPLPPVYSFSQQTEKTPLKTEQIYPTYDYQTNYQSKAQQYNNGISDDNNPETAEDKNYAFSYTVRDQKTGDDFSHSQRRSGSSTNGEYRVRLPDGRVQIVSYTADENGYNADVRYDVDPTANGIEYNNYDVQNVKDPNNFVKEEPKYSTGNKLYADYQPPTQAALYGDTSKEYYNDHSTEYNNNNYAPHQSKFGAFEVKSVADEFKADYITSTAKPNYVEIRDVLSKALPNVQPTFNYYPKHETTEQVVLIGGRNRFNGDPSDNPISSFIASTPRSYLASTIASLRDRVSSKPLLSDSFINRINKYLSFK